MNKKIFKKGDKPSSIAKAAIATLAVGALSVGTLLPHAFLAAQPVTGPDTGGSTGGAGGNITKTIDSLFNTAKEGLKSIYKGLLAIVTILAVVICAWCFCVKMFSKNPRSIDEATQWIKRVCIAWLCFMLLSVFVAIGVDIVGGAGASTTNPWG